MKKTNWHIEEFPWQHCDGYMRCWIYASPSQVDVDVSNYIANKTMTSSTLLHIDGRIDIDAREYRFMHNWIYRSLTTGLRTEL